MKISPILVIGIITLAILILMNFPTGIAANCEEFLPGVEGVNNVTWGNTEGYPDGYYKEGYPVDD